MQKLIRLLIIYIAILVTALLIIILLNLRGSADEIKKSQSNINLLNERVDKLTQNQKPQSEVIEKLEKLSEELTSEANSVLGQTETATPPAQVKIGFVTINDKKWQDVYVYDSKSYSGKTLGKLEFNKAYRFAKKDGSWYEIYLPNSDNKGWVAERFLKEISDEKP